LRIIAALVGTDNLSGIHGVGFKTAHGILKRAFLKKMTDHKQIWDYVRTCLKREFRADVPRVAKELEVFETGILFCSQHHVSEFLPDVSKIVPVERISVPAQSRCETFVNEEKSVKVIGEDGIWIEVSRPRRPKLAEHLANGPKQAPAAREIDSHVEHRKNRRKTENESMKETTAKGEPGRRTIKFGINIFALLPEVGSRPPTTRSAGKKRQDDEPEDEPEEDPLPATKKRRTAKKGKGYVSCIFF
jgi:5'-3' exonuclease